MTYVTSVVPEVEGALVGGSNFPKGGSEYAVALAVSPHDTMVYAVSHGRDGLHDIRHIAAHAQAHLERGGWLMLEHGYDQAAKVRELLQQNGFGEIFSARDLAGIERVSGGRIFS